MGYVLVDVRALLRPGLVLVVLVAAGGGSLARASVVGHKPARLAPASRVVLRTSFQPMRGVVALKASGDYLLFSTIPRPDFDAGWNVTNQRTGIGTALDPQCDVVDLGPPWVLMQCPLTLTLFPPSDVELYSLTDGTQQTVTPSAGLPLYCPFGSGATEDECATLGAVGVDWIRWDASCYNCAVTSFFQNIQTGELRDDRRTRRRSRT